MKFMTVSLSGEAGERENYKREEKAAGGERQVDNYEINFA